MTSEQRLTVSASHLGLSFSSFASLALIHRCASQSSVIFLSLEESLGYVLFPENRRENTRKRNYIKSKNRKKMNENKNRFKINKLFLFVTSDSFYLFISSKDQIILKYINFN